MSINFNRVVFESTKYKKKEIKIEIVKRKWIFKK